MSDIVVSNSRRLYVNHLDTHYMMEKSRQEGLKDLHRLAKKPKLTEESWVWIRVKTPSGSRREFWFEIGSNETKGHVDIDVTGALYPAIKKASEIGTIIDWGKYHTHPAKAKKDTYEHPPSDTDVTDFLGTEIHRRVYNWPIEKPASQNIVSPHGIWSLHWQEAPVYRDLPELPADGVYEAGSQTEIDELTRHYDGERARLDVLEGDNSLKTGEVTACRDGLSNLVSQEEYREQQLGCLSVLEGVIATFNPL